jgi:uncharacterized phiE125 gp8 family phage protein
MDFFRNVQDLPCNDRKRPAYNAVLGHFFENESPTEPVSLDEAKDWLKITFDDADDELTGLISEVRQIFEEVLGLSLITRDVGAELQFEIGSRMELPYGPVDSVTAAIDADGNGIDAANYEISSDVEFKYLKTKYDYIKLFYTAGYSELTIPRGLKNAMLREIAWRYNHRGDEQGDSNAIHVKEAYKYRRGSWLL